MFDGFGPPVGDAEAVAGADPDWPATEESAEAAAEET